jgi:sulfoxide reductase heme-binding subunit YedZ
MSKALKSWPLFWALALAVSVAICLGLPSADFHVDRGTEFIILHAVLCALPLLVLAFTASSLASLWPNRGTRWLLANRRYIGLAFAFGMAWHFAFVGYFMFTFGNRLRPIDLALDIIGLCFLLAMTLTSFQRVSRHLSRQNWRRLHKTGIYTLWALPTYFFLDDYLRERDPFYLVMFGLLLAAVTLRAVAWTRRSVALKRSG